MSSKIVGHYSVIIPEFHGIDPISYMACSKKQHVKISVLFKKSAYLKSLSFLSAKLVEVHKKHAVSIVVIMQHNAFFTFLFIDTVLIIENK